MVASCDGCDGGFSFFFAVFLIAVVVRFDFAFQTNSIGVVIGIVGGDATGSLRVGEFEDIVFTAFPVSGIVV